MGTAQTILVSPWMKELIEKEGGIDKVLEDSYDYDIVDSDDFPERDELLDTISKLHKEIDYLRKRVHEGFKITSLSQLKMAANMKKSVWCPDVRYMNKPKPAAFVINMSGEIINRLLNSGMYLYKK